MVVNIEFNIKAEEDARISKVISLAGVSDYEVRFPKKEDFQNWEKSGVYYVQNGRTKQQMPHYFQFYKDFVLNKGRLTISRAVRQLKIPHLIIHGDKDVSVNVSEAHALHQWNPKSKLVLINGADHVFGTLHPWKEDGLSAHLEMVINEVDQFLRAHN